MIRILHSADFHLDTPFEGLPEEKAVIQRKAQRELLRRMAELCRERNVRLVLLAGDLLDSGLAYFETWESLTSALEEMTVPVFIAPGNHDFCAPDSPYLRYAFPKNVHIFTSHKIDSVTLPDLNVRIWGAGFNQNRCPSLLQGFSAQNDGLINIMVIHGQLGGTDYNPITEAQIAASGLDYIALGHVHTYSGVRTAGKTAYAFSGCPMGRGFDETGKKGVVIADVGRGSTSAELVPLGGREYKILQSGENELDTAMADATENDIIRLILTGKWIDQPDLRRIIDTYSGKCFHLTVVDRTSPARDIWYGIEDDSLRGLFLRRMRERLDDPAADRDLVLTAVRYGLDAFDNREVPTE